MQDLNDALDATGSDEQGIGNGWTGGKGKHARSFKNINKVPFNLTQRCFISEMALLFPRLTDSKTTTWGGDMEDEDDVMVVACCRSFLSLSGGERSMVCSCVL